MKRFLLTLIVTLQVVLCFGQAVRSVPTIDNMVTNVPPTILNGQPLLVLEAKRGGLFRPIAATTTNLGTVFPSTIDATKVWERIMDSQEYNIDWFGALPGSANGGAATVGIQDAIDTAFNAGGGNVYIPAADDYYYLTNTITLKYRVNLIGSGARHGKGERSGITIRRLDMGNSSLKLANSVNLPMVAFDEVNGEQQRDNNVDWDNSIYDQFWQDSLISGVFFHGNGENQTSSSADILDIKRVIAVTIENCGFVDSKGYMIRAHNLSVLEVGNSYLRNEFGLNILLNSVADTKFYDNQIGCGYGPGIWLVGGYAWLNNFNDNHIWNSSPSNVRQTFSVDASTDIITAAGHGYSDEDPVVFTEYGGGTLPAGIDKTKAHWVIYIDANTFRVSTKFQDAEEDTGSYLNITDTGSGTFEVSYGPAVGIYMTEGRYNFVGGNRIDQHYEEAIRLNNADGNVFYGNNIVDASYNNVSTVSAILLENGSSGNQFNGNFIGNSTDDDLDYGVTIESGNTGNIFKANRYNAQVASWQINDSTNSFEWPNKIFIDANRFRRLEFDTDQVERSSFGSRIPTLTHTNAVETTVVFTGNVIPPEWQLFTVDVHFGNRNADTGNVKYNLASSQYQDGDTVTVTELTTTETFAAPAQNVYEVIPFSKVFTNDHGIFNLRGIRDGDDAADTLGNSIQFIGMELIRTK